MGSSLSQRGPGRPTGLLSRPGEGLTTCQNRRSEKSEAKRLKERVRRHVGVYKIIKRSLLTSSVDAPRLKGPIQRPQSLAACRWPEDLYMPCRCLTGGTGITGATGQTGRNLADIWHIQAMLALGTACLIHACICSRLCLRYEVPHMVALAAHLTVFCVRRPNGECLSTSPPLLKTSPTRMEIQRCY